MRLRSPYDRRILGLALPALGALAAEPLYVLVDTAVVGHLGPELAWRRVRCGSARREAHAGVEARHGPEVAVGNPPDPGQEPGESRFDGRERPQRIGK